MGWAQKAAPREEKIKQVGAASKKSTGQENRMIRTQATGQWLLCHHNMRDKEQDKDPNSKCQVPGLSQGQVRLSPVGSGDGLLFLMYSVCFLKQDSTIIAQAGPELVNLLTQF